MNYFTYLNMQSKHIFTYFNLHKNKGHIFMYTVMNYFTYLNMQSNHIFTYYHLHKSLTQIKVTSNMYTLMNYFTYLHNAK